MKVNTQRSNGCLLIFLLVDNLGSLFTNYTFAIYFYLQGPKFSFTGNNLGPENYTVCTHTPMFAVIKEAVIVLLSPCISLNSCSPQMKKFMTGRKNTRFFGRFISNYIQFNAIDSYLLSSADYLIK